MLTYIVYLVIVSVEETFAYSGYTVMPTSFFLAGIARRTDMHVLAYPEAKGNFSSWGIMDWICKTNIGDSEDYDDDAADEAEELGREKRARQLYEAAKRKAVGSSRSRPNGANGPRRR